jgi:Protein of unknown function (DUF3352)
MAMQEPISESSLLPQSRRRPWWLFVAPIFVVAALVSSYWAVTPRRSKLIGMSLLPANTVMAAQIAIDRSAWLQLKQLGTVASRAMLERELAKLSQDAFGNIDVYKNIPSWLGNEIYVARLATGETLALLSMRTTSQAEISKQKQYRGAMVWGNAQTARAIISHQNEKFLAIGSKAAIEQVINAQQGRSLVTLPSYAQMTKTITGEDSIAQVYINLPAAMVSKSTAKLSSQALLMNISSKDQVLTAKGVMWSNKKLVRSERSPEFATQVPASSMLFLSGSSLGKLWAEYLPLATNNPLAPLQPQMLQDSLKSSTGLDLNTNVLSWGSGEWALAIVAQTPTAQAQLESGSVGGSLLLFSRSTNPVATDQTMNSLDKTMADRYKFKVDKTNLKDLPLVRWSGALGGTQATHGWLPNQVAFLTLGAPISEQFLPSPDKSLANHADFRQVMSTGISPIAFGASKAIDAQVYMDVNKMSASGNLPLQKFPADTQAILQAINSIGLVTNAVSDQAHRFDLSISLKSIAGK